MDRRHFIGLSMVALGGSLFPQISSAQSARALTMGVASAPNSLDPQFQDAYVSVQANQQIYSSLLFDESSGVASPNLATSHRMVDAKTWEVKLRQGVKFHDGTPFEAEDVVFSYERVPHVVGATAPFIASVRGVERIEIVDPETIRFYLKVTDPLFPWRLTQVAILSRKIHANATNADFNSGKAAIGTGPYRFVSGEIGHRLELEANPDHWWGKQAFEKVTIRYIPDAGARLAALRSGDVDLIDAVPSQDAPQLRASAEFSLFETPSFLTVYLFPDAMRDVSPMVVDAAGKPLSPNPLKDLRVRRAISLAMDRNAITTRLMSGQATPANQTVSEAAPDRAPSLPALEYDPAMAKKLLAEAGYPNGFDITIQGPNGFFNNDVNVLQAVGQGLARIGIRAKVEVLPTPVLLSRGSAQDFSLFLIYFNSPFASIALQYLAMTYDPEAGNGSSNRQRYSNPKLDQLMKQAMEEPSVEKHRALIAQAMAELMSDKGQIPIMALKATWAGRKNKVVYSPNPMNHSSVFYAKST